MCAAHRKVGRHLGDRTCRKSNFGIRSAPKSQPRESSNSNPKLFWSRFNAALGGVMRCAVDAGRVGIPLEPCPARSLPSTENISKHIILIYFPRFFSPRCQIDPSHRHPLGYNSQPLPLWTFLETLWWLARVSSWFWGAWNPSQATLPISYVAILC